MITYGTSSIHNATCTFTWNSKFTTYSQKNLAYKGVDFLCHKCSKPRLYTSICNSKNFPEGHIPGPPWKGRDVEGKKKEGSGEEGVEGGGLRHGCWGDRRPWSLATQYWRTWLLTAVSREIRMNCLLLLNAANDNKASGWMECLTVFCRWIPVHVAHYQLVAPRLRLRSRIGADVRVIACRRAYTSKGW